MADAVTQQHTFLNGTIQLIVDAGTLRGSIVDRASGAGWQFAIMDHMRATASTGDDLPCHLVSVAAAAPGAGGITADLKLGDNSYRIGVWLDAHAPDVVFDLQPLEESSRVRDVVFPGPLLPASGVITQFVIPKKGTNGVVHYPARQDHWVQASGEIGLMMPFWGLGAAELDVLCILETADDVTIAVEKSIRQDLQVMAVWAASLGTIRYARRLRVKALPTGGYVPMAKAYRAYVKDQGRFKSLAEKIAERPLARQVVGGPYFSLGYLPFSERKFRQVVHGLREIGYTSGIIGPIDHIQWDSGAWLNDYQPFIKAPQFSKIAADAGFAAFAWLYLEDILTWDKYYDPSWVVQTEDGHTIEGWFNRDYEYQLLCSKVLREKHHLMRDAIMPYDALHFDTTTSKRLGECWHPDHTMSRTEDRQNRYLRLADVASWNKLIGSEAGYDWAFDVYDFCSSNPRRGLETGLPVPASHIPLLGLVYHDSVVSYCWEYDPYNGQYFGENWAEDKLLYDVMAGNPPTVAPVFGYFPVIRRPAPPVEARWVTWEDPATQKILRDTLPVAQLHGRTAHCELLDHSFVSDNRQVSRTVYADGTEVLVNFDTEPHDAGGSLVVAARGYHIG